MENNEQKNKSVIDDLKYELKLSKILNLKMRT